MSSEFVLSEPWVLRTVLDNVASVVGTPDMHTFTPTKEIQPFSLGIGMDLTTANQNRVLLGCLARSLSLRTSLGEVVRGTLDVISGKERAVSTTLSAAIAPDDDFPVYTFEHASIELPGGTTLAEVQSMDLTMTTNAELLYGVGNAEAVNGRRGLMEITGRFQLTMKDNVNYGYVNARTDVAALNMKFTNGATGNELREIEFQLTGLSLAQHTVDSVEPNENILESLDFQAKNISAVAKNNDASYPA